MTSATDHVTNLFQRHGDRSNLVFVRTTLQSGEDGEIDFRFQVVHDFLPFLVHVLHTATEKYEAISEGNRSERKINLC